MSSPSPSSYRACQPPPPGHVDLWLCGTEALTPARRAAYGALLSAAEQERHRRFAVEHARDAFLLGRALVRTSLSHYADVTPREWVFAVGDHGRPFVAEPRLSARLHFNLSHTRGLVACAVSAGPHIGVDVEQMDRRLDPMALSAATFAAPENEAVQSSPEDHRRETFFRIWTLKEAYIKALGVGLSLPLDSFWFDLGPPPRLHVTEGRPADDWQFFEQQATPGHWLALAHGPSGGSPLQVRSQWVAPLEPAGLQASAGQPPGRRGVP